MLKLSKNERLVLYGLIKWPEANDVDLSEKLNVKRSTLTNIRNKLEKESYYSTTYLPSFEKLGCELLIVRYGSFNPLQPFTKRRSYFSSDRFSEVFFVLSTDFDTVSLSTGKNYTQIEEYMSYSTRVLAEKGFLGPEGMTHLIFPLRLSTITTFFDYSSAIKNLYNLQVEEEPIVKGSNHPDVEKELSYNEKKVLYGLVKYPKLKDDDIADKVAMSRQSVTKMRKRFTESNVLKTARIPDARKIGFNLMVFEHSRFQPHATFDAREEAREFARKTGNRIFTSAGNLDAIKLSIFKDYTDFQRRYSEILRHYLENDFILGDPVMKIFPMNNIRRFIPFRFAPLLKDLLEIRQEI